MPKQKKIEKLARKARDRSFHPALPLLAQADRELVLVRTLASHQYGLHFNCHSRSADTFISAAAFHEGEARAVSVFAEVPGHGLEANVRCGLRMDYFVSGKATACCVLTFSRGLGERDWTLRVERFPRGPKPDQGISHALRRIRVEFDDPRLVRDESEIFKLQDKILKDYHEMVLIPRKAKPA